jgi:hypothetical protein
MKPKSKLLWRPGVGGLSGGRSRLRSDPIRKGFWLDYYLAYRGSRGYQAKIHFGGEPVHTIFAEDFTEAHALAKAWCEANVERLLDEQRTRFERHAAAARWEIDASSHVKRVDAVVKNLTDELVLVALGEVDALPPDTRAIAQELLAKLQEQKDVVARSREVYAAAKELKKFSKVG